jgi:hypothetical protein
MDSWPTWARSVSPPVLVTYQWLIRLGASPVRRRSGMRADRGVRRHPPGPLQTSLPKDGTFFCGVTDHDGGGGPGTQRADRSAHAGEPRGPLIAVYAVAMVTSFPYVKLARVLRLPLWVWVFPAICAYDQRAGHVRRRGRGYLVSGPLIWLLRNGRTADNLPPRHRLGLPAAPPRATAL